jgi:hypothetical protein
MSVVEYFKHGLKEKYIVVSAELLHTKDIHSVTVQKTKFASSLEVFVLKDKKLLQHFSGSTVRES